MRDKVDGEGEGTACKWEGKVRGKGGGMEGKKLVCEVVGNRSL